MTISQNRGRRQYLKSGPLIISASLVGAGGLIVLAGFAVGGSHMLSAARRWVRDMEVPPGELARRKWAKAKAAATAGRAAWRQTHPPRPARAA